MSTTDELERLAEMHRRGDLDDAEFSRAKARLLNGFDGPAAPASGPALNALRRSRTDRWLGGVCGGLARLSGLDAWAWRLGFTVLALFGGSGVLVYALMWIFVPQTEDSALSPRQLGA